jgi:uncharacterized protein (DUF305 family)
MLSVARRTMIMPCTRALWLPAVLAAACSSGSKSMDRSAAGATDTAVVSATATATTPADTMAGMSNMKNMDMKNMDMNKMGGMQNMTGDADRDFLRMMSDHHKGLVLIAHMTKERKDGGASKVDAATLDAKQDKELDRMQTMLEKDFKDPYVPKVTPDNQAMADELKGKSGADYERTFYQDIIKHHQAALKMVDDYLPKGKSAAIKQMAQTMKADQAREIADFQKKVARIK